MRVRSLGGEDPLEEGMATHSIFLPGESHGQKSRVDYSPWGRKESDTAEVTWHACMLSDRICASTLLADGETKAWRWEGLAQSHVGQ